MLGTGTDFQASPLTCIDKMLPLTLTLGVRIPWEIPGAQFSSNTGDMGSLNWAQFMLQWFIKIPWLFNESSEKNNKVA